MTIQITNFSTHGSLLGSATASLHDMGAPGVGSYKNEQVLFRCSPDSAGEMFEYYSTNGDSPMAGHVDVHELSGIPGTYRFPQNDVVSRVTNVDTGELVTRYWKSRRMLGVDTDEQGWFLVKVKNFSRYTVDLFQCKTCGSVTNDWWQQPIAYVAFKGGAAGGNIISPGLRDNADHNNEWSGFYEMWPGSINPKLNLKTHTGTTTCAVRNTTPVIRFQPKSVEDLMRGDKITVPITIDIQCENKFYTWHSGTADKQTAMGIMARPENAANARPLALVTGSGSAVTYLLSDGYGTKNVAKGVGVTLSRPNNRPMYFLTNRYITMGGAADGWEPVLDDATENGWDNDWKYYTRTINATFEAFNPRRYPVTPGKYNATAEVVISIQ
ncbi:MAG: fimbrial protein [Paraburkholderia sp.]|nr:MAG: fimbrial protein [Paraburkholderia sp.]TAM27740.1 MAG: fimbrial protein [Paraburkholderia sp.]